MNRQRNAGTENVNIEYHADDYGLFVTQSRRILQCRETGRLNGISVIPNGKNLAECMAMLREEHKPLAVTVHLNLTEGKAVSPKEDVWKLTDAQGNLNCTFGKLLIRSFLPGRKELRRQLKQELRAQIQRVEPYLPENSPLRLDGHAHYHMIPVVFDAMMDVIREDGLKVEYIRIPEEHLSIYLRNAREIRELLPVNLVKVLVLNLLTLRCRLWYGAYLEGLEQRIFMGVFLSGRMLGKNVEPFLENACRLAGRKKKGLEILAHPGGIYEPEDQAELTNPDDIVFLTSPYREKEASLFQVPEGIMNDI